MKLQKQMRPALRLSVAAALAGVVFAAAAVEILPQIMHAASVTATFVGGASGVGVMLSLKSLETRWRGPVGMLSAVGIDILIDGLVLGLAFIAGAKAPPFTPFAPCSNPAKSWGAVDTAPSVQARIPSVDSTSRTPSCECRCPAAVAERR